MTIIVFSSFIPHLSSFFKNCPVKIRQLNRRRGGFKTLVAQFDSSAFNCLVHVVGSYHSKNYRHSGLQSCFADAARDFTGDVFEVWSLSANDCAQANDRIKLF